MEQFPHRRVRGSGGLQGEELAVWHQYGFRLAVRSQHNWRRSAVGSESLECLGKPSACVSDADWSLQLMLSHAAMVRGLYKYMYIFASSPRMSTDQPDHRSEILVALNV